MLTQEFVLSIMQASITGAGLVLAIYTLIIPLSRRFFGLRAESVNKDLEKLKEKVAKMKIRASYEEREEVENLIKKIGLKQTFPEYLRRGMALSFFGYVISALMSVGWVLNWENHQADFDKLIPFAFVSSTILFLVVGLFSIKDISKTMEQEFEELKKEIEKAKASARQDIAVENL